MVLMMLSEYSELLVTDELLGVEVSLPQWGLGREYS